MSNEGLHRTTIDYAMPYTTIGEASIEVLPEKPKGHAGYVSIVAD